MTGDETKLLTEKYGDVCDSRFEVDRKRLSRGEPLAYVIGWQPFLGLRTFLDSHPLIPRPETEWWTEQMFDKERARGAGVFFTFLDLCAGSGAIGCAALARFPNARVSFGEIDPVHAATIKKNIRENGLDISRADIRIGNLFEPFGDTVFDIIAVNPPYIPEGRVLPRSVTRYEPALSLFSGTDGLDLIRRIAKELPTHVSESGRVWIECDAEHAEEACAILDLPGFSSAIFADQYGLPRVVVVSRHP